MSQLALDDDQRDALARHLDDEGVAELVGCEAPPDASARRGVAQSLAGRGRRPAAAPGRAGERAEQRADRQPDADVEPLLQSLPGPVVYADFPAATALASADENCAGHRGRPR